MMTKIARKQKTFFNLFPPPEYLLFSTSGVAITDDSIKYTQIKRNVLGTGLKLTRSSVLATPEGSIEAGDIKDQVELASSLGEICSRYGLRYVRATLPDEKAYLFNTTIDRVPQEGLEDAVAFVVEENVPLTLPEAVFSFEAFESSHDSSKIDLTVSVLPRSVVDTYTELFESVGVTPVSFDLESQAIARSIVKRGDWGSYLVVNLSLKKTGIYVVDDGVVKFSITPAHNMNNLHNIGDLRAEINKVLTFWNSRSSHYDKNNTGPSERKIEKIILCGVGAGEEDFVLELMKGFDVEHTLADVWTNTAHCGKKKTPLPLKESLQFADAIGLALPHKEYIYV